MANNDILTRLLLNTDDFDRKIGKSKKQTDGMADTFTKFGKTASKALVGVAGAIGAATTATEAFNKAIASSDSLADKWKGTMQGMTTAVNEFFRGLTTGDFSVFHQGLDKIIDKARDAVNQLKTLSNFNRAYDFLSAEQNYNINEAFTNLKNPGFTGDRSAEIARAQAIIDEKTVQTATILEQAARTLASNLATATGIDSSFITPDIVRKALEGTLSGKDYSRDYARWADIEARNRAAFTRSEMVTISGSTATRNIFDEEGYNKVMAGWNRRYAEAIIENALHESTTNREGIEKALAAYTSAWQESTAVLGLQKTLNKVSASVEKTAEAEATKAAKATAKAAEAASKKAAEGSVAALEEKLAEARKAAAGAVGLVAQAEAQKTVEQIEKELKDTKDYIASYIAVEAQINDPYSAFRLTGRKSKNGLAAPAFKPQEIEEASHVAERATISFGSLATAIDAVSGALSESGQTWASYAADVLQAVAAAIPAIDSLIVAHQAEKTAAGQAAAAQAASSVAGVPVAGPLLATAAVASVVAAIMNMPKFANGGIVGGSSYVGDRLLVRANSGEVILNQAQQRNLLSQLDSRHVSISGELRASGRDLVATLNNYNTYQRQ